MHHDHLISACNYHNIHPHRTYPVIQLSLVASHNFTFAVSNRKRPTKRDVRTFLCRFCISKINEKSELLLSTVWWLFYFLRDPHIPRYCVSSTALVISPISHVSSGYATILLPSHRWYDRPTDLESQELYREKGVSLWRRGSCGAHCLFNLTQSNVSQFLSPWLWCSYLSNVIVGSVAT